MITKIMVPLDGSELAERALPCAVEIAAAAGAALHVVRVFDPRQYMIGVEVPFNYDQLVAREKQAAAAYLDKIRERLQAADVQAHTVLLEGHAASALLDYEREAGIDLVVMSSHGRSGIARFDLGSVAERLLRYGTVPLLRVGSFGAPAALSHAVVPLDGSRRAERALTMVEALSPQVIQDITLLRVIEAPEQRAQAAQYLEEVAARLRNEHVTCRCQVMQGDPAWATIEAADGYRLVVIATYGREGLVGSTPGSVTDTVVHGSVAGVLLLRGR